MRLYFTGAELAVCQNEVEGPGACFFRRAPFLLFALEARNFVALSFIASTEL
jgi:hypothetical protein